MPKKSEILHASEPETPEWTFAAFAQAKRFHELPDHLQTKLRRTRGPQKSPTKELVSLRLSPDVLEVLRSTGPGWQTRVDEALRSLFVKQA